jgi:hypothetical protein
VIKKVKEGYQVFSSKGRNLGGPYKTLAEAKRRLRQIEFFKHRRVREQLPGVSALTLAGKAGVEVFPFGDPRFDSFI